MGGEKGKGPSGRGNGPVTGAGSGASRCLKGPVKYMGPHLAWRVGISFPGPQRLRVRPLESQWRGLSLTPPPWLSCHSYLWFSHLPWDGVDDSGRGVVGSAVRSWTWGLTTGGDGDTFIGLLVPHFHHLPSGDDGNTPRVIARMQDMTVF